MAYTFFFIKSRLDSHTKMQGDVIKRPVARRRALGRDDASRTLARATKDVDARLALLCDAMGCVSSSQVRPRDSDEPNSPRHGSQPASALVESVESPSTSGRRDEVGSPRRAPRGAPPQMLAVATPPASPGSLSDVAAAQLAFAGVGDPSASAARSPPMSPVAVTEGMFGGKKASPQRNRGEPRAVAASTASPTAPAPAKKKLTATQQQEADRRSLQEKLSQVDDLMFKATQKSIALATMEESMIRLQRSVAVERDGRVVAENMAEQERLARERAEAKIQKEIEERHDLIARLDRANDVARHAENEARDIRLGMKYRDVEVDRSAQEKILEADLALVRRELMETVAKYDEERSVRDLGARMEEERPRLDEDSERTRVERRIKEAVQMALAKHEREASMALMKASEEKVRALEVASVQRRQAMEVQARLHQEELRRAQEAAARDVETLREELRPTRWEIEKLQEDRVEDQRKHAEDRRLALEQASVEYEANLEKIKLSHAYELSTLRGANEERLAVYERERAKHETKFSVLTSSLTVELAEVKAAFERERELRRLAEDNSARDMRARDEAEAEFERLRADRREALDLVSEARRARDTAERRTKETYLEIERARVAGEKRRFMHSSDPADQRPSTAEREVEQLPQALGLLFEDDLIAAVAEARAETHDLTAPKRAADLELEKYRARGGADSSVIEELSAKAYMRATALERAGENLKRALDALHARRAAELEAIDDERRALARLGDVGDARVDSERAKTGEDAGESPSGSSPGGSDSSSGADARGDDTGDADANAKNVAPGLKKRAAGKEAVVETFTPPSSPPAKTRSPVSKLEEAPRGNRDGSEREPSRSNPARPQVKPFKFTPLEW